MAKAKDTVPEITAITVAGFKSIAKETRIEIAPLTLLAGANSSGKSSVMQPLLLLKQTLEATYDPGALLLSDSPIRFMVASQLLVITGKKRADVFKLGVELGPEVFSVEQGGLTPSATSFVRALGSVIHIPPLRGNPQQANPSTATGPWFVGPFPVYTASIVLAWQERGDIRLKTLSVQLGKLGMLWKVEAARVGATNIELRVGRLPALKGGVANDDLVNIADAGVGVSQTLPVLVALLVAEPGQLVYLEQPEIHLHPRAQVALAEILIEAAKRGVKVVAESHSSLLLIAIQTSVAEGKVSPDWVKLHWFQRGADGLTTVSPADLDEAGAFGDWPEDFGRAEANIHIRYLNAAEARDFGTAPPARKAKAARK